MVRWPVCVQVTSCLFTQTTSCDEVKGLMICDGGTTTRHGMDKSRDLMTTSQVMNEVTVRKVSDHALALLGSNAHVHALAHVVRGVGEGNVLPVQAQAQAAQAKTHAQAQRHDLRLLVHLLQQRLWVVVHSLVM